MKMISPRTKGPTNTQNQRFWFCRPRRRAPSGGRVGAAAAAETSTLAGVVVMD